MFKSDYIKDGYQPLFALIEETHLDVITSQTQLYLFEKRTDNSNIKTQILQSESDNFLLVLYIKDEDDDESLQFLFR
jgi:hypothetical protein